MKSILSKAPSQLLCVCLWIVELIEFFINIDSDAAHKYNGNKFEKRHISPRLPLDKQREKEMENKSNRPLYAFMHLLWSQFTIEFRSALSFFLWDSKIDEEEEKTLKKNYLLIALSKRLILIWMRGMTEHSCVFIVADCRRRWANFNQNRKSLSGTK